MTHIGRTRIPGNDKMVRGDNYDVEVMRPDGRERIRLTTGPRYDGQMSWSPDGNNLVFISERDGVNAVYVAGADGRQTTRLTTQESLDPEWSH